MKASLHTRIGLMLCGLLAACLGLSLNIPAAHAADWCVDPAGGACYTTIQAAVNAAGSGDTINIHAGTYYEHVTVNKSLTFVGAGAAGTIVDGSGNGQVFNVTAGSVSFSDLTVQNGKTTTNHGGGIYASGNLALTNVDVLNNTTSYRGGGALSWGSMVMVTGGRFENNTSTGNFGGGLYAQSTLIVSGTRFINNTVTNTVRSDGGGVYGNGATTLTNAQFISNTAGGDDGGGVYANTTLALFNTQFISNTAAHRGGGAYIEGAVRLSGGLFQNNLTIEYDGGGLYTHSTLVMTDTRFLNNTGQMRGGGAFAYSGLTLNGGLFQNNTVNQFEGGGVCTWGTLTLTDTQFLYNSSLWEGGGAFAGGAVRLNGGLFQGNHSSQYHGGGGLYASSTLALTDTQFLSNLGQHGGGAVAVGMATLSGGRFEENMALSGGGLYAVAGLVLTGTQFFGNLAYIGGGGLTLESGYGRLVNALFARNAVYIDGDALYLFDPAGAGGSADILHTTIVSPTQSARSAILVGPGTLNIANTIIASATASIAVTNSASINSDYNLFFNAPTSLITGSHSLTGVNPLFVNPAGDDYHLRTGSPAINAGVKAGILTDLDGRARDAMPDIGAYEVMWYTLTAAQAGDGSGSVTSQPAGLDCPTGSCSASFVAGVVVSLTAIADPGSTFTAWSPNCALAGEACIVTMTANTLVTATFTQNQYTLTVERVGSGLVTKQPDQVTYVYGDGVTLTAVADPGWSFAAWSPNCALAGEACIVTITANTLVTATFTQNQYTLTVETVGSGSVTKQPDQATYVYGDGVTLTAIADPGWSFTGWGGGCAGYGDCLLTLHASQQVTAIFGLATPLSVTLPISAPGSYAFGALCGGVTFTDTGSPAATFITVTLTYTYPSIYLNGLPRRYDIETNGIGFLAAVTLCYGQADLDVAGVTDELALHVYRYTSLYTWTQYSRVNPISNTVTAFGVNEFGMFGLGVGSNQPTAVLLPVFQERAGLGRRAGLGVLVGAGILGLGVWWAPRRARKAA